MNYSQKKTFESASLTLDPKKLSSLCNLDSKSLTLCIQEIYNQCVTQLNSSKTIKLNLKVGFLLLTKKKYEFEPNKDIKILNYHPSNPNPFNEDFTLNSIQFLLQHKNSKRLPPLTVHSKPSLIITNKFSTKQVFDPYLSNKELYKINKSFSKPNNRSFTPTVQEIYNFSERESNRQMKNLEIRKETDKINKSLAEYKKHEKNIKKNEEKLDYFPFNNGNSIEANKKLFNIKKKLEFEDYLKNTSFTKNDDIRGFSTSSADKSQVLSKQDKFLNLNIIQSKKNKFF